MEELQNEIIISEERTRELILYSLNNYIEKLNFVVNNAQFYENNLYIECKIKDDLACLEEIRKKVFSIDVKKERKV